MIIVKKPFQWISAHRKAEFTFDYSDTTFPIDLTASNDDKLVIIVDGDGITFAQVGQFIYVDIGVAKGYHKVTEILATNFYKTDTDFIEAQLTGNASFITDEIFTLYAGYDYPSELAALLPKELIATFKPEPNADGQLVVNISGYVNKLFDVINSNDTVEVGAVNVYYNLATEVELRINDVIISTHIALNAAIDMFELNRDYVNTGRTLNGGSLGDYYLSCGTTTPIIITGGYVVDRDPYTDGIQVVGPDFLTADFLPGDFRTTGG